MPAAVSWHVLPAEIVEQQISQIELLRAMYPGEDEILMEESSANVLNTLQAGIEGGSLSTNQFTYPPSVALLLRLARADTHSVELDVDVPFYSSADATPEDASKIKVRLRQPGFMNKAAAAQFNAQIPNQEDLFSIIDFVNQAIETMAQESVLQVEKAAAPSISLRDSSLVVRAWFYFPSISTRSKRDDLVEHAPSYSLTGFLFAGKPGLLCLEGASADIDAYMKFIKTESWGDIPAHHKKVTERYREKAGVKRIFTDMQEITDSVGDRRGARANRGDMKAVESWLGERGLGDVLAKVLM